MARLRPQAQPSGHTILVVDDNRTIVDILARMLTQEGHTVLTASGGQEAIQLCRAHTVHLMLLDYFMPDLTGQEVVRQVRCFDSNLQIVLQTGYASEKPARQMLRELDIQGYHDKSEGPEKLLIWVDAALKVYRAKADLARAMRLKDDFLATMSHELRTPLNAILGLSEALQEQVYGPLNAQQLKSVRGVEEGGRHLLALINDILDLAKIGAGKMDLQCTPIAMLTICQASLRFIKPQAENKEIILSSTIDPAVTTVYADERRLMQILVNLLSNAVKFTPRGGTVGIDVTGDPEHEVVQLAVWDTGIGIAEEDRAHLFQPFTQLDSGLARQHEGTGLGLALVARMVELHGGSIEVASTVGQGSRFTISLPWPGPACGSGADTDAPAAQPLTPETSATEQEPDDEDSSTATARVLLAEDNEANITVIYDYLQAKGYEVIVARNGTEAVARAREITPDLILMDIQMPDMDGIEAIQRIHSDGVLVDLPIIALTALAMPGDRERCLAAGADDYVSKPIRLNTLISILEAHGVSSRQLARV